MSGHSHAKTIKHQKDATDAKRGQMFSKLARMITVAAKQGGGDPALNSKLRMAFEKAKEFNMPKDNIERALKKGTGEIEGGATIEEFIYEAYGPNSVALIIEGVTDNKNRTLGEIKNILAKNGGKLAESGTVKWMFDKRGVIGIGSQEAQAKKEEFELMAIEAGAEDLRWHEDGTMDVFTKSEELEIVKNNLKQKGVVIESGNLDWVAKNPVETNDESVKKQLDQLFEALDENDDVQDVYSNIAS